MGTTSRWSILAVSLLLVFARAGEARNYQTWCKSFATGENLACTTITDYGGSHPYSPGVPPTPYTVPDNTLFNVRYEAGGHEKALFSMFIDSQISTCAKGGNCSFSRGPWETRCIWNSVDSWVCTVTHREAVINQYYLLADFAVRNYRYLAADGSNSPPVITAVPAVSYPENAGSLSNIVDLWFYAGDDRTPKQQLSYAIVSQTNPALVSCSVRSNRYIDCVPQPAVHGFSDVTFSAKDAEGAVTSGTFRITITPAGPSSSAPAVPGLRPGVPPTPAEGAAAPAARAETRTE
jgi:hypothetical protein